MYNGVINVYKEPGYTSFDVVAKLRGILKQKKIGHTGTLDPMAEGVLLVLLGQATKLSDMLTAKEKEYEAELKLGITTDTEDIQGNVLSEKPVSVSKEQIEEAFMSFVGTYPQIPPMYSAIKKDGKKLYEYARAGIEIRREAREVTVYSLDIRSVELPYVRFSVKCSKGTYIRSLCRDIGEKLGTGAVMSALVRSEVNGFLDKDALRLAEIEQLVKDEKILPAIIPMDRLLGGYPKAEISAKAENLLLNGNKLKPEMLLFSDENEKRRFFSEDGAMLRVYRNTDFTALYTYDKAEHICRPYKMFLER